MYVGAYIQTASAGGYPSGSLTDFFAAPLSAAFPGGSKGASWTQTLGMLTSVIPAVCFSSTLQAAVAKTVDDPSKKVSDLVVQIGALG